MNSFLSDPPTESSPIQVWADVGGTFTDVFVLVPAESGANATRTRRAIKTLSSGATYVSIVKIDGQQVTLDRLPSQQHHGFWNGASWSTKDQMRGTVLSHGDDESQRSGNEAQYGNRVTLSGDVAGLKVGTVLTLDAELEAPVLATRILLGVPLDKPLPSLDVRLGTTRGTNALLTRQGARTALMTTRGFGDLLQIGEQDRDDLFSLDIVKPEPLTSVTVEVDQRMDASGRILEPLPEAVVRNQLATLKDQGIESLAVCFLHAHTNGQHERRVAEIASEFSFENVSISSEVSPLIKLVSRAETTVLDAYLNPILRAYVHRVEEQLGGPTCRLRWMTSGGNLVESNRFRGRDSVLSGPAGGVVALARVARDGNTSTAIGLDMGGTSTDVSRFDGHVGRRTESRVAGVRIMTPMMDIQTVAAGGGSICDFRDGRLVVGPQSAGAFPGPACYGHGGPATVTDVNFLLGRLPTSHFPFSLDHQDSLQRLEEIRSRIIQSDSNAFDGPIESLAEGFLDIAVTHMAEAVRTVSTSQGCDVRTMTLVGFGGAAGAHLCRVAEQLGVKRILDHPDAGMLSALGMGLASEGLTQTLGVYRLIGEITAEELDGFSKQLVAASAAKLNHVEPHGLTHRHQYELRYEGTESSLTVARSPDASGTSNVFEAKWLEEQFTQLHQSVFGYHQSDRNIELVSICLDTTLELGKNEATSGSISQQETATSRVDGKASRPPTLSTAQVWHQNGWLEFPVVQRHTLSAGQSLPSPAMIVGDHSTLIVEPGWNAKVLSHGEVELLADPETIDSQSLTGSQVLTESQPVQTVDRVLLEVVARRLQGIADTMGEVLRRTSISVNVKERRDYSCAVFRGDGSLVANAAHVPVHLGAMGHTVKRMRSVFPRMSDGDCYLSNDPYAGGSHLPDVTLVTPVFVTQGTENGSPDFFVASRAHHAEIGGKTPGSMPPDATCLAEEGVLISDFPLERSGVCFRKPLLDLLRDAEFPSRNPEENLADISAQQAAGMEGVRALRELCGRYGQGTIDLMMTQLLDLAAEQTRRYITTLSEAPMRFVDQLDDGTPIGVTLQRSVDRLRMTLDPTPVHQYGFNATPAIVTAAVMYVLRCVSASELPLCDGLMRPIELEIPSGLLNPPGSPDPRKAAAVVAGNVETSQRLVDVLLGALGKAAASQGTMNNVLMGDDSFGYYETIGGGSGATANADGADAVHTHMTNTRITDPEIVETRLPVRLHRFAIRQGSGGWGVHRGGDGLIREFEFLRPLTVSLLTNRRTTQPYGLSGGAPGESGQNLLVQAGRMITLPSNVTLRVNAHDRLVIHTPGGGGFGSA